MNMSVDQSWTFEQAVKNIRALRTSYEDFLCSFSYFQLHDRVKCIRQIRNDIYALNLEEWLKDKLWQYMNHNTFYSDLLASLSYTKRRGKR